MKKVRNYINIKKKPTIVKATNETLEDIVFDGLLKFGPNADLNYIDTGDVTMFRGLFSHDIRTNIFTRLRKDTAWTASQIKDMNPDVSKWDTSSGISMLGMFYYCNGFNCDISEWDVSNVRNTRNMFHSCLKFNQDLSSWNLENAVDVCGMFNRCESLDQDFSSWKLPKVSMLYDNIGEMFDNDEKMSKEKYPPKYAKFKEIISSH